MNKEEKRPRIRVKRDALFDLRDFADRRGLDRDMVYGRAVESFAEQLATKDRDELAAQVEDR